MATSHYKFSGSLRFEGRKDEGLDEIICIGAEQKLGSEENPIQIEELLSKITPGDRTLIKEKLRVFYKNIDTCDYPADAQFLAVVLMKHKQIKEFPRLVRILKADNGRIAEKLGFQRGEDGKIKVPTNKNFWHFVKMRIGEGLDEFILTVVRLLHSAAEEVGIKFGKNVGHDSMRLKSEDKEAEYNGHYKTKMYKGQKCSCLDTLIPLCGEATLGANSYDGHYMLPYTEKLSFLPQEKTYADGHYATLENYAKMNVEYGIETYFHLEPKTTPHSDEGEEKVIEKLYQKYWEHEDFRAESPLEYKLKFLVRVGEVESVGYYYRNRYRKEAVEDSDAYGKIYHRRSLEETMNSKFDEMFSVEHTCNGVGVRNMNLHWKWCILAMQLIALIRLRHGIKTDLTSVKGIAF